MKIDLSHEEIALVIRALRLRADGIAALARHQFASQQGDDSRYEKLASRLERETAGLSKRVTQTHEEKFP